jgi:hypothetical protein
MAQLKFNTQQALKDGYSPQQIQQYIATKSSQGHQYIDDTPAQPAAAQPPQDNEGFLTKILPFIGGVGGSLVGSLAGPVGTVGGGAAGAGLGETIRQLIRGHGLQAGDIGKEAAFGGLGGVGGELLGPAFRFGSKLVGKAIPDALDKAGTEAIASQFNLPRTGATALKLPQTIEGLHKYGITNIDDIGKAADIVTGQNGIAPKIVRKAISQAAPVDTTGIREMAKTIAANPTMKAGQDDKFIALVDKGLQTLYGGTKGNLADKATPEETFDFIRQLQKMAADLKKGKQDFQIPSEDKALIQGYHMIAQELESRLYGGLDATGKAIGKGADSILTSNLMTPEEYQALAKLHPQLAEDIKNAKTIKELRSIQEPFTKGNQAADYTEAGSQLGFKNIGQQSNGAAKFIPSLQDPFAPLRPILGSNAVNAKAGEVLKGGAENLRNMPQLPGFLAPLLAQLGGQGAAQGIDAAANPEQQPPVIEGQIMPGGQDNSGLPMSDLSGGQQQPSEQDQLRQVLGALMFSKAKSPSDIAAAYSFLYPQGSANKERNAQKIADAQSMAHQVFSLYFNLGGTGRLSGVGSEIAGKLGVNPQATSYEALRKASIAPLARAISGETGTLTDKDIARAEMLLPKITDTPQEAQLKYQNLMQIMQARAQNLDSLPSGSNDYTAYYNQ